MSSLTDVHQHPDLNKPTSQASPGWWHHQRCSRGGARLLTTFSLKWNICLCRNVKAHRAQLMTKQEWTTLNKKENCIWGAAKQTLKDTYSRITSHNKRSGSHTLKTHNTLSCTTVCRQPVISSYSTSPPTRLEPGILPALFCFCCCTVL